MDLQDYLGTIRIGDEITQSPPVANITLEASDGSASFAGDIQVGEYQPLINVPGVNILAAGAVTVNRTTGAEGVWSGRLNRTITSEILANGSASFTGKITAADYDLEALPPLP